jgi:hypothetical protein
LKLSRQEEVDYLKNGVHYSWESNIINKGLWGTSVGGRNQRQSTTS